MHFITYDNLTLASYVRVKRSFICICIVDAELFSMTLHKRIFSRKIPSSTWDVGKWTMDLEYGEYKEEVCRIYVCSLRPRESIIQRA